MLDGILAGFGVSAFVEGIWGHELFSRVVRGMRCVQRRLS